MYKGMKYKAKALDEMAGEFVEAARRFPDTRRIFLADGDAMFLPFGTLRAILEKLGNLFPRLSRVNSYANGSSILAKTAEELRVLRGLKLNTLYLGLESGCEKVLELVSKGETAAKMTEAARLAQDAGLRCSVMALLGIGGRAFSKEHVEATAETLNAMAPRLLSILRFIEVPGAGMFDGYEPLSELESVRELRSIIERLELDGTVFTANHASIPVPLKGRLPKDKSAIIEVLDEVISSGVLDDKGPGPLPLYL
jgi:radical SAM superfamily enzyme YgiQ (UPF0313 family)